MLVPLLLLLPGAGAEQVLDTRGDWVGRTDRDGQELNFAQLAADPVGNLPERFTICSATFLANRISRFAWFDILNNDGNHWIFFYQKVKNLGKDSSELAHSVWFNVNGAYYYLADFGPFQYNRWVHLCVGLDTVAGVISAVADGQVLEPKQVPGLGKGRPETLAGRLVLGKTFKEGRWRQDTLQVGGGLVYHYTAACRWAASRCSGGCWGPRRWWARPRGLGAGPPGTTSPGARWALPTADQRVAADGVGAARPGHPVEERDASGAVRRAGRRAVRQHRPYHAGGRPEVGGRGRVTPASLCRRMQGSAMPGVEGGRDQAQALTLFFSRTVTSCSSYWLPYSDQVGPQPYATVLPRLRRASGLT
jgi:hypothetical protein